MLSANNTNQICCHPNVLCRHGSRYLRDSYLKTGQFPKHGTKVLKTLQSHDVIILVVSLVQLVKKTFCDAL